MPLDRRFKQRISKLERNMPSDDGEIPSVLIIDAQTNRNTDIEAEISSYQSGSFSHLTRKQASDFVLGKTIKTVDPDTGRPLSMKLINPKPWNGIDNTTVSSESNSEETR